jgi:predicted RNase H-like HicB family nuclease
MTDHHINVFHSDEDDGYIAEIPDLPGCSAFGRTPEEAVGELVIAKHNWMEAAMTEGLPIPLPHYRPASAGSAT